MAYIGPCSAVSLGSKGSRMGLEVVDVDLGFFTVHVERVEDAFVGRCREPACRPRCPQVRPRCLVGFRSSSSRIVSSVASRCL